MSNADVFQHLMMQGLIDSTRGSFENYHNRVKFKLDAAEYFLKQLEKLESENPSLLWVRDQTELNLDVFLYEVVGALDPILHQINMVFLSSELAPNQVSLENVIAKLPSNSQLSKRLRKVNGDTEGWFCRLRQYRNWSSHISIIGFNIQHDVNTKSPIVYLHNKPGESGSGAAAENLIEYCKNSLDKMSNLVEGIYKDCIDWIQTKA